MLPTVTIAIVIRVHDGLVLAADSATTMSSEGPNGQRTVDNIYNHANKIFNLHKGLPIGAATWGLGNIGPASIATLAKDLRRRFMVPSEAHPDWELVAATYTMTEIAQRVKEFLADERYEPFHAGAPNSPELGFLVGGYSAGADEPELYVLRVGPNGVELSEELKGVTGAAWWGQPEAITRLLLGISNDTTQALINLGHKPADARLLTEGIKQQVSQTMVPPAMPIQDAIELAEFLVYATIQFVRFAPGSPTVGGPIEIATITKHEGFKWVTRKHYFESRFNPPQENR